jgi:hypothetical protein
VSKSPLINLDPRCMTNFTLALKNHEFSNTICSQDTEAWRGD